MSETNEIAREQHELESNSEKAARLFFFSFFHSQGHPPLQVLYFQWIHNNFPNITLSKEEQERAYQKFLYQAAQYFKRFGGMISKIDGTPQHDESILPKEGKDALESFAKVLNSGKELSYEELTSLGGDPFLAEAGLMADDVYSGDGPEVLNKVMLKEMIDLDLKYALTGRDRKESGRSHGIFGEQHLSQVCTYILLGSQKTSPEFVKLFSELKIQLLADSSYIERLEPILKKHIEAHPADKEALEKTLNLKIG